MKVISAPGESEEKEEEELTAKAEGRKKRLRRRETKDRVFSMYALYHYDHCPYCVKARMIFGLKKISCELKALLNDDEETPRSFIGQKMVPILKTEKGFMPESLDIVRHIDDSSGNPSVNWKENPDLQRWFNTSGDTHYFLAMPRWVQAPLEEFKTPAARTYFQKKKEGYIGPFEDALKDTDALTEKMSERLEQLETLLKESSPFFQEDGLSVNDFHLFAYLRALSIVKPLSFPKKTRAYMESLSKESRVPLHLSIAL